MGRPAFPKRKKPNGLQWLAAPSGLLHVASKAASHLDDEESLLPARLVIQLPIPGQYMTRPDLTRSIYDPTSTMGQ